MSNIILPKFIIVGAAKCGTSALWYNLDKHPDIHMATKTDTSIEMRFWKHKFWNRGFEWYSSRMKEGKINGEKTPSYFTKGASMKAIKKYIPDVKLILCARNPADRAYSSMMMAHKGNPSRIGTPHLKIGRYMDHIEKNVLPFFDKEQLYICITEYMKQDPTTEMKKVFEFLGVEDLNLPKKIITNKTTYGGMLDGRSRQEDIKLNREEPYYRVWSKWTKKKSVEGKERERLLKFFKPHNERFFNFIGYEIKEWDK